MKELSEEKETGIEIEIKKAVWEIMGEFDKYCHPRHRNAHDTYRLAIISLVEELILQLAEENKKSRIINSFLHNWKIKLKEHEQGWVCALSSL